MTEDHSIDGFRAHLRQYCLFDKESKTYTFTEQQLIDYLRMELRAMQDDLAMALAVRAIDE